MIFVTGGTGLVGTQLLFDLTKSGSRILALKRVNADIDMVRNLFLFRDTNGDEYFNRIEWVEGALNDYFVLEECMERCDEVYHVAAVVSFHKKDKNILNEVNVDGTATVVNAALSAGIDKFCHISSTAAIGRVKSGQTITELEDWKDSSINTPYAISKYNAELEVWRGVEEGLKVVVLNPSVVIGPGTPGRSSGALFTRIGKGMPFYPPGSNAFVDVKDVSRAAVDLMASEIENSRFLVTGENLEFRELFEMIARANGNKIPSSPAKKWMLKLAWAFQGIAEFFGGEKAAVTSETVKSSGNRFHYDSSKIKQALGFKFSPVKNAVEETVEFLEWLEK